jgi:Fe-S-cluster containining protein
MDNGLPILNIATATYECTFGRGCEGVCCQEGRPPVEPEERNRIDEIMTRLMPLLRSKAQAVVRARGYLTDRRRFGHPMARNADGWCVFFNQGCVLHQLGADEGDKFRYKPSACSLFPIQQDDHDDWYIRQHGYKRERWDLFCLSPTNTTLPAAEALREEIGLAVQYDAQQRAPAAEPSADSAIEK